MTLVGRWLRELWIGVQIAPSYNSGMATRAAILACLLTTGWIGLVVVHREPVASRAGIAVSHPWTNGEAINGDALTAFMIIENQSTETDRLLKAWSPMAERIVIERAPLDLRAMQPIVLNSVDIEPRSRLVLRPYKTRITLHRLKRPVFIGQMVPLTVVFARAGQLDVTIQVEDIRKPEHTEHF